MQRVKCSFRKGGLLMVEVGQRAIDFCLKGADEKEYCLKDFLGKWLVLYFYPKDNTSGCTKEAVGFTDLLDECRKLDCNVVGISPDSPERHRNFIEKYDLKVLLLSDPEHKVLEAYGAWGKKRMYGREYFGVIRTTYLIDPDGRVAHVWSNVKVKGHPEAVLEKLKELKGS